MCALLLTLGCVAHTHGMWDRIIESFNTSADRDRDTVSAMYESYQYQNSGSAQESSNSSHDTTSTNDSVTYASNESTDNQTTSNSSSDSSKQ